MVNVRKDLTGMKFNHLQVLKQAEDYVSSKGLHYAQWVVKCDCGKSEEFIARDSDIKNGHVKSCGCIKIRKETVKSKKDLSGQKFGRLTVLRQAEDDYIYPKSGQHESKWWVKCDCGNPNEFTVRYGGLTSGNTKSCGCLAIEARTKTGKSKKKYNTYDLTGEYGIGYTSKGEEFWFDLEDYDKIKDYCWYYSDDYLRTNITVSKGKQDQIAFHRLIMDFPKDLEVDHILHPPMGQNKFDNRKSNLRIVTKSKNQMNKHIQENNTSGVVGVRWHKRDQIWEAFIDKNKESIYLGRSTNKEDMIRIRKEAEEKYFGEYSFVNSGNGAEYEDTTFTRN